MESNSAYFLSFSVFCNCIFSSSFPWLLCLFFIPSPAFSPCPSSPPASPWPTPLPPSSLSGQFQEATLAVTVAALSPACPAWPAPCSWWTSSSTCRGRWGAGTLKRGGVGGWRDEVEVLMLERKIDPTISRYTPSPFITNACSMGTPAVIPNALGHRVLEP